MSNGDMIERLARVMWAAFATEGTYDEDRHDDVPTYRGTARKVIEAMREPTEAMVKAGVAAIPGTASGDVNPVMFPGALAKIYPAMITEALK